MLAVGLWVGRTSSGTHEETDEIKRRGEWGPFPLFFDGNSNNSPLPFTRASRQHPQHRPQCLPACWHQNVPPAIWSHRPTNPCLHLLIANLDTTLRTIIPA